MMLKKWPLILMLAVLVVASLGWNGGVSYADYRTWDKDKGRFYYTWYKYKGTEVKTYKLTEVPGRQIELGFDIDKHSKEGEMEERRFFQALSQTPNVYGDFTGYKTVKTTGVVTESITDGVSKFTVIDWLYKQEPQIVKYVNPDVTRKDYFTWQSGNALRIFMKGSDATSLFEQFYKGVPSEERLHFKATDIYFVRFSSSYMTAEALTKEGAHTFTNRELVGQVTSADPTAYPQNGISKGYYYVFKWSDSDDPHYVEQLDKAEAAVAQAETTQLQNDVNAAVELINKLRDPDKGKLVERIVAIQKIIDAKAAYDEQLKTATQAVEKAEASKLQTEINMARTLLVHLNDTDKQQLNDRLDRIPVIDDLPKDITSPSKPKKLVGSIPSPNSVILTWEASTDDVGVVGYDVYRDGQMIGNTKELTFQVDQLEPQKIYKFAVKAKDAAGNYSEFSNSIKSGLSRKYKYIYDANGRLEHIEQDGQVVFQYHYDANGNLIQIIKMSNTK